MWKKTFSNFNIPPRRCDFIGNTLQTYKMVCDATGELFGDRDPALLFSVVDKHLFLSNEFSEHMQV